jgi:hypothetical protein
MDMVGRTETADLNIALRMVSYQDLPSAAIQYTRYQFRLA